MIAIYVVSIISMDRDEYIRRNMGIVRASVVSTIGIDRGTLMIQAASTSEMSENCYQSTCCNNPDDGYLQHLRTLHPCIHLGGARLPKTDRVTPFSSSEQSW
jgi:hypothetical protein